jgi:flavin reductase (DIM6/NTAB) family NADH-FMN oxidoreductase RutF
VIDPDTFRAVLGRFASGITVVTARDDSGVVSGMTVSAFCSVSLEPPLVLACVDHAASIHAQLAAAAWFGVSILAADQETTARRFADPDRGSMDSVSHHRGEHGMALVDGAIAHLECRVTERLEAGDHTILIARVEGAAVNDGEPLIYYRGGYAKLER